MRMRTAMKILPVFALVVAVWAQAKLATQDSATFDAEHAAHITRVVPMPNTVSPEAQQYLIGLEQSAAGPESLVDRRKRTDIWREKDSAEARKLYPVDVQPATIGGVQTDIIMPLAMPDANRTRVLINLHGGGFNSDSGSLIEGVPIANLAKTKVVSVYYRLAPENPYPAAVDDVVAVYKELLKTYRPSGIGIFGTSAGAILTAQVTAKLKQFGIPLPAAIGIFSGFADFSRAGESRQLFTLTGFSGDLQPMDDNHLPDDPYVGKTDRKDPLLSPIFSDLRGWPSSLLVTSGRDILLSGTTIFHRALLKGGNDSQLIVFEALPHAFWYHFQIPETKEALEIMANFFGQKVGH